MKELYLSYFILILLQLTKSELQLKEEVFDLIVWVSILLGLYRIAWMKYFDLVGPEQQVTEEPEIIESKGAFSKEINF